MSATHKDGEAEMASALDALQSTLANLDRSSTEGINAVIRRAESLATQARRIAGTADKTQQLTALPGGKRASRGL